MKITSRYFLPIFIVLILLVFSFHLAILSTVNHPLFSDKIIESYLLNSFIAVTLYFIINQLKNKFKNGLGFLFILGSLIKFLLFYALIYPSFKLDGNMSKYEFASFFIPYFTCLIYETLAIATLLNNLEK
jgi:hypothetical protein